MLFKNFGKTRTVFVITPVIALAEDNTASVHTSSVDTLVPILVNDSFGTDFPIAGGLNITNGKLSRASANGRAISIANQGTGTASDDVFKYSAPQSFTGDDNFNYTIIDLSGDASTTALTLVVDEYSICV